MIRRINNNERDILMSSYAITDIYNIIWTFIRYGNNINIFGVTLILIFFIE